MGKFYPARDKFRVRVRGAQAVGVVYLSRFIWIPKRPSTSINLSIIGTGALFLLQRKMFFPASTELEKNVHLNNDCKLLKQRDTHFGRYRVTVIILSFKVTLWKVRPMLSQYWSSSSGLFLDTRPSCKKAKHFQLTAVLTTSSQTVESNYRKRLQNWSPEVGFSTQHKLKSIFQGTFLGSSCTRSLLLLQLRFANIMSKEEHLGFIYHPFRTSLARTTTEQPTKLSNWWMCLIWGFWDWQKEGEKPDLSLTQVTHLCCRGDCCWEGVAQLELVSVVWVAQ